MPIWIENNAERPYLCYRFSGTITPDDLERLAADEEPLFAAFNQGQYLGVIVDLTGVDTIAARLFPQLRRLRIMRDEQVCAVCIVGANPYLRALSISLGLFGKPDFVFRQTIEEAVSVLDHHLQSRSEQKS